MEPDLDRIVEFELDGGLFPQFRDRWSKVFSEARILAERVAATEAERPRVAINTADPLSFCAIFLALCRSDFDLLFYGARWGASEFAEANRIGGPHWIIGDFGEDGFSVARNENAGDREGKGLRGMRVAIPTGGTSGKLKFAVHDWKTLAAAAYGLQFHMACNSMSSHCMLPLYHVSGFMQIVRSLLTVGTVVFGSGDTFKSTHQRFVEETEGGRFLSLVPTQLMRLLTVESHASLLAEYDAIFVGGAPLAASLREICRDKKLPLAMAYGMTETAAQVATLTPKEFLGGTEGSGKRLPHASIDIVDEDSGEKATLGEIGRVRIRSTSLFYGYYGESGERSESIVTPDLGRIGDDGSLVLMGRADGVIVSGGEKVNPREIEMCLEATNLLEDVAVFGVEDREWGTKVAVVFQPKGDFVTEEALRSVVAAELATFKIPKLWFRVSHLPRNEAGKLLPEAFADLAR